MRAEPIKKLTKTKRSRLLNPMNRIGYTVRPFEFEKLAVALKEFNLGLHGCRFSSLLSY